MDTQTNHPTLTFKGSGSAATIQLHGEEWRQALQSANCKSFRFQYRNVSLTARCERKKGQWYWYAYRRTNVKLRKAYLGKLEDLTVDRLLAVAARLSRPVDTPGASARANARRSTALRHLPVWRDPLIGRERELALVSQLLVRDDVGLVTLTGTGGSGKTRLAAALAADLSDRFPDGVCFVPLAPLQDPARFTSTVAQALGVHEAGDRPLLESLIAYLCNRQLLLVLDNFEHLFPAATVVSELLSACRGLTILVTSRAILRLSGEHEVPVPPLALPGRPVPPTDQLSQYEAVRLFVDRARAARPDFSITTENAQAVAEICARLDGLPLAIELAAPRLRLLTVPALLARLERRLPLLVGGAIDLPPRHQTLRGTIAWSYDLLSASEQALFRGLAVFVGGCTLAAAQAVVGSAWQLAGDRQTAESAPAAGAHKQAMPCVSDLLEQLIEKSLVRQVEQFDGQPRYVMLETIHEFALDQLDTSDDAQLFRQCHAAYYLTLAETAEAEFWGPHLSAWTERLRLEIDNVRAALQWCTATTADSVVPRGAGAEPVRLGLALAGALRRFWDVLGRISEGRERLAALLALAPGRTAARATALNAAGFLAWSQGDIPAAQPLLEEGLSLAREHDLAEQIAFALVFLGCSLRQRRCLDDALARLQESLPWWDQALSTGGRSLALFWLADALRAAGDSQRARVCLEEGLTLSRELDDHFGMAFHLAALGRLASSQGDQATAIPLLRHALVLWRDLGDVRDIGVGFNSLALSAAARGQAQMAARLFGAAAAVQERPDLIRNPIWEDDHSRAIASTRARLGETVFAATWEEGRALPLDLAIEEALAFADEEASRAAPTAPLTTDRSATLLSARERQVAALIAHGYGNVQISATLCIARRTVESHVTALLNKLGLANRTQVARWAIEHDLQVPDEP